MAHLLCPNLGFGSWAVKKCYYSWTIKIKFGFMDAAFHSPLPTIKTPKNKIWITCTITKKMNHLACSFAQLHIWTTPETQQYPWGGAPTLQEYRRGNATVSWHWSSHSKQAGIRDVWLILKWFLCAVAQKNIIFAANIRGCCSQPATKFNWQLVEVLLYFLSPASTTICSAIQPSISTCKKTLLSQPTSKASTQCCRASKSIQNAAWCWQWPGNGNFAQHNSFRVFLGYIWV